ncbi:MAG: hypothetical protein V4532_07575 [Pseudomonadota bacterium]
MKTTSPLGSTPSRHLSPSGAVLLIVASLALCGLLDYVTGYEVSVFVVYVLPIVLSMRFFGWRGGSLVALLCATVWVIADMATGHHYSGPWVVYWNALNRLAFFMCVVVGVHYTQSTLAVNRKRLEAFSGPLPICTQCHRIGARNGYWQTFDSYLCEHGGADPQHKVCPDCARQRYAQAGVEGVSSS